MAIYVKRPSIFSAMNIAVCPTVYEFAGDVLHSELVTPLSTATMLSQLILFKGTVKIEYPGTDELPRVARAIDGLIFPQTVDIGKTSFHTTALEDNTEQYAIRAISLNSRTIHIERDLVEGQQVEIEKGIILVVFGNSYTVNGNIKSSNQLFAVEKSDAIITAIEPCKLFVFKAVPLEI